MDTPRKRSMLPLSEVSRELVDAYLLTQGHSSAIIRWKYFDDEFNAGQERALVWMQGGAIAGFIGILPFSLGCGGERIAAQWTFDWSLTSPGQTPGMGIMLLQRAVAKWHQLHSFGGNENTRSLLPRFATYTDATSASTMMRPLSLGYWLDRVRQRVPQVPIPRLLDAIRWPARDAALVDTTPGVSPLLAPLLDAEVMLTAHGRVTRPAYDLRHLSWLIGRCPLLESWTITSKGGGVGALLWRRRDPSDGEWRVALWIRPGASTLANSVLDACAHHAATRGATHLAAIVATNDDERREAFAAARFTSRRGFHPLYISATSADHVSGPITALSYLDADMAYLR